MGQTQQKTPHVFISSTSEDLLDYREAAKEAAIQVAMLPVMMEYFTASGDRKPLQKCMDEVDTTDVLVVLSAHRYGWVPPDKSNADKKSVTWLECEQAVANGCEVLAFLVDEKQPWPEADKEVYRATKAIEDGTDTPELLAEVKQCMAQLKKFKDWLNSRAIRKMFTTPADLCNQISNALHDWRRRNSTDAAGGKSENSTAPPIIPDSYLDWVRMQYSRLELLGLQSKRGLRATLGSVYVPLTTTANPAADVKSTDEDAEELPQQLRPERGEEMRETMLLDVLSEKSLYVSGSPGSGKSTFCRWVALLSTATNIPAHPVPAPSEYQERLSDQLRNRLPVLVPLREFWECLPKTAGGDSLTCGQFEDALQKWIDGKRFDGLNWELVRQHLQHGTALLIFDGMDEVPLDEGQGTHAYRPRAMLLAGLSQAIARWTSAGNRLLVTSRPYGLSPDDEQKLGLPHARLSDLPPALRQLLVHRWFHCLEENPDAAKNVADDMLAHLQNRPEIVALAANPLMLTAICIIFHEGGRLPQDKYDLYKRITQTVLAGRYGEEFATARGHLCAVAYGMHTGHGLGEQRETPQAEATVDEVDRIIRAFREETAGTERGYISAVHTRDDLLTRSGILESNGHERAAFYHLSFQEYLAGERWLDLSSDQLFAEFCRRAVQPNWRNTLSFVFAALIDKSSSADRSVRLLSNVIEKVTAKNMTAEDFPSSEKIPLAVVASDCLEILWGRGHGLQGRAETAFRDYCLAEIASDAPLTERFELGLALGKIGDPRIIVDLRDHENRQAWVPIPAGDYFYGEEKEPMHIDEPFLITRFLVTNAQYRVFLKDGGYKNKDWWSDAGWQWKTKGMISEPGLWRDPKWNNPTQPVVRVSWYEADAFARWAGGRLPREREWEAAARGPDGLVYPWGNDWTDGICNSHEAGLGRTSPVGLFPHSRSAAFGLEDMSGNVWEWCEDVTRNDWRVLRGGSWSFQASYCRAATRVVNLPVNRYSDFGFRLLFCLQNSP